GLVPTRIVHLKRSAPLVRPRTLRTVATLALVAREPGPVRKGPARKRDAADYSAPPAVLVSTAITERRTRVVQRTPWARATWFRRSATCRTIQSVDVTGKTTPMLAMPTVTESMWPV